MKHIDEGITTVQGKEVGPVIILWADPQEVWHEDTNCNNVVTRYGMKAAAEVYEDTHTIVWDYSCPDGDPEEYTPIMVMVLLRRT